MAQHHGATHPAPQEEGGFDLDGQRARSQWVLDFAVDAIQGPADEGLAQPLSILRYPLMVQDSIESQGMVSPASREIVAVTQGG